MKITITGRHIRMDDDIRSYAEKKLQKAETYFDRIIEAHMILSAEKHRRMAEVTLHAKRARFHAQSETESIYASIDEVMEKVDAQIRKHKEKIRDRKHQAKEMALNMEEGLESDFEEAPDLSEPQIIKVSKFAPKPMTPQEAIMEMTLSGDDFLMFSNSQTNQVNVIYRRNDGNYGWIEPNLE
jgi:putative sigma-54 modulation protein